MEQKTKMTAQEIDRIECAIRHIKTSVDIDPWAVEIAVEAMRKQIADSGKKDERTAEAIKTLRLMQAQVEWDYPMEYAAAIDEAIKALKAQEWIPVDEKSHPDTPERVQVQLNNGWIITAYYEENEWLSVPDCGKPLEDRWIEAWRPLPEPYQEDENER